jgi:ABC-type ATPase with predicted acetyltransferase domain
MSRHTDTIRSYFGLREIPAPRVRFPRPAAPLPHPGQILWIAGPSGSGKSTLLRHMRRQSHSFWIDVNRLRLPDLPVVDCFDGRPLDQSLPLLSRLGLAEVWTYLRRPRQLSAGQRFRLRLALALCRAAGWPQSIIACDEFAAALDPVTAAIAARCLRRAIGPTSPCRALLAGSREDLLPALAPDRIIQCDFGTWSAKHETEVLQSSTASALTGGTNGERVPKFRQ